MFGIVNYGAFIAASVLLNVTPGADTIYILTKSASGGRKQGIASALGISSGILIHTVLVSLGLSVILATSAMAFHSMKLLGATYLLVMGIRTLLQKGSFLTQQEDRKKSTFAVYRQGVITNALNPKVALFFLTLLPQYVSAGSNYGPLPFLLLGLTFVCTSTIWCVFIAFCSSFLTKLLQKSEKTGKIANRVTGCIYIGLGLHVLQAKAGS